VYLVDPDGVTPVGKPRGAPASGAVEFTFIARTPEGIVTQAFTEGAGRYRRLQFGILSPELLRDPPVRS
jgi:hypothetical protein